MEKLRNDMTPSAYMPAEPHDGPACVASMADSTVTLPICAEKVNRLVTDTVSGNHTPWLMLAATPGAVATTAPPTPLRYSVMPRVSEMVNR